MSALADVVNWPRPADQVWDSLADVLPADWIAGWAVDDRRVEEQMLRLAEEIGIPVEDCLRVNVDLLGDDPGIWPDAFQATGVFDRPGNLPALPPRPATETLVSRTPSSGQVREFIAGLRVQVRFSELDEAQGPYVVELIERAKDFTLGPRSARPHSCRRPGQGPARGLRRQRGHWLQL